MECMELCGLQTSFKMSNYINSDDTVALIDAQPLDTLNEITNNQPPRSIFFTKYWKNSGRLRIHLSYAFLIMSMILLFILMLCSSYSRSFSPTDLPTKSFLSGNANCPKELGINALRYNSVISNGRSNFFLCCVGTFVTEGNPEAVFEIEWFHGERKLCNSTKISEITIQTQRLSTNTIASYVSIINATEEDTSGYYICRFKDHIECQDKITLNISKLSKSSPKKTAITTKNKDEASSAEAPVYIFKELIFNEDFSGANEEISSNWILEEGYSNFEIVSCKNVYIKNGSLYLKPVLTAVLHGEEFLFNGSLWRGKTIDDICKKGEQNHYRFCHKPGHADGIINPIIAPLMKSKFNFMYGKVEIRAKTPTGDWIKPIINLVPENIKYGDVHSESGLIQMVNTNGNEFLYDETSKLNKGAQSNCPSLVFGTKDFKMEVSRCGNRSTGDGYNKDFHLYQLEWTPDYITLGIDGEQLLTAPFPEKSMFHMASGGKIPETQNPWKSPYVSNQKTAPFDDFFSIRVGISVGGTNAFSDENKGSYEKPWNNSDPKASLSFWRNRKLWESSWIKDEVALKIDYIKVWSCNVTRFSATRVLRVSDSSEAITFDAEETMY